MSTPFPPKPAAGSTGDVAADVALADQEQLDAENAAVAGGQPSTLGAVDQATLNDDWAKVAAWDVTDAAGRPVMTLDGLADVLGTDRTTAAGMLLSSPMAAAAPPALAAEANAEVNPAAGQASLVGEFEDEVDTAPVEEPEEDPVDGDVEEDADDNAEEDEDSDDDEDDDTPAFLKKALADGRMVTLADGRRGRIELIVSNGGTVPGSEDALVGTKSDPAARVRVYRQAGGKLLPTGIRVAVKSAQIQRETRSAAREVTDVAGRLVLKAAQHPNIAVRDGLTPGKALQEVYRRGQAAWPGEEKAAISAQEWALGRVDAFVQKASGFDVEHYTGDNDLLG